MKPPCLRFGAAPSLPGGGGGGEGFLLGPRGAVVFRRRPSLGGGPAVVIIFELDVHAAVHVHGHGGGDRDLIGQSPGVGLPGGGCLLGDLVRFDPPVGGCEGSQLLARRLRQRRRARGGGRPAPASSAPEAGSGAAARPLHLEPAADPPERLRCPLCRDTLLQCSDLGPQGSLLPCLGQEPGLQHLHLIILGADPVLRLLGARFLAPLAPPRPRCEDLGVQLPDASVEDLVPLALSRPAP
mmetsp:Transcript_31427/g.66957  ORF Transcript_31427/g.66957 Transcript_31427/m.66957 type:complete len:240 (-) Transcript_31427:575-1294(-)